MTRLKFSESGDGFPPDHPLPPPSYPRLQQPHPGATSPGPNTPPPASYPTASPSSSPTPAKPLPLSRWEAAGPFPAGMREQPLTASPLCAFGRFGDDLNEVDPELAFAHADYGKGDWPSELPMGGRAGWVTFDDKEGEVEVVYPDVRWKQLRADHGWASLQYSALLRTRITIPSFSSDPSASEDMRVVLVDALQVVEYAFVPLLTASSSPPAVKDPLTWYGGDIYAFATTPSGASQTAGPSNYARSLALPPGEYVVLVRAVYECRLFGEPGDDAPVIKIGFKVYLDSPSPSPYDHDHDHASAKREAVPAILLPGLTVVPDLLDGWAMGQWASVAVQVPPSSEESIEVRAEGYGDNLTLGTVADVLVAPGQTRNVPLLLAQLASSSGDELELVVTLTRRGREWTLEKRVPLKHVSSRSPHGVLMTYASPAATHVHPGPALLAPVSSAVVLPPSNPLPQGLSLDALPPKHPPVLLALHGAGVPTPSDAWIEAMPQVEGMWAILPSGRTEWGEDWHGSSLADVWAARDALPRLAKRAGHVVSDETLLLGHSNGGQGAWHAAARYPDRIRGVIALAGYTKIQDYVPFTELTSSHYADPALLGILNASLAPYNNDLYASNLASVPVLAVHGAEDDNVPLRHGRAHCAIVAAWSSSPASKDVQFIEVPHVGHVWDGMLRHPAILKFIKTLPARKSTDEIRNAGFTLATANPDESGGKAGIRIAELAVPGRLARLDVNARQWRRGKREGLDLHGTNVRRVEVVGWGQAQGKQATQGLVWSKAERAFIPDLSPSSRTRGSRAYGPVMRLLASPAQLTLVVPSTSSSSSCRARSIATHYAHDLRVYHRLDARIMGDEDALRAVADGSIGPGSVVVLGAPDQNVFTRWMMAQKLIPVRFPTRGVMTVEGRLVWEEGTGIITLHPHPTTPTSLACIVAGNDELGLVLAARLLPLRTGVSVPDWAVVSPRMRWQAAGGLVGAGFWGAEWEWSEGMSWFDRE